MLRLGQGAKYFTAMRVCVCVCSIWHHRGVPDLRWGWAGAVRALC